MKEATSKAIRPILVSTLELSGDEYASWLIKQYKKRSINTVYWPWWRLCQKIWHDSKSTF